MHNILMPALGVAVTVILGLLGFFGKTVSGLLKNILAELQKISGISIQHDERIKNLERSRDDHETRIRTIENNE